MKRSYDEDRKSLEDMCRDPNLPISAVRDKRTSQENEIAQVAKLLKDFAGMNEFVHFNSFKAGAPYEREAFGTLNTYECSKLSALRSKLVYAQQWVTLMRLCDFQRDDKWTLLYRASNHGFGATDFHSRCDGHANTLTIIKVEGSENVFGGYARVAWNSSKAHQHDPSAFVFSLVNKKNKPCLMKIDSEEIDGAINCEPMNGPSFGWGDITILDNSNKTTQNISHLGNCYTRPSKVLREEVEDYCFLAGTQMFQVNEIEVFEREIKPTK